VLIQYVDLEEATALDLFSGTGSITLELLSRGCQQVISVEMDRDHHRFICECIKKLDTQACIPLRADVFRFLKSCHTQFDFIFADPPYALKEIPTIPDLVFEKGLLKEEGLFILEHGKDHDFSQHPHFVEHRSYGSVNFSLFR
jgi:16S rRNA (guanine(966)-N(2))-methyltransferase RsmD